MNSKLQQLFKVYVLISVVTLIGIFVFFSSRAVLVFVFGLDSFAGSENVGAAMLTALRFDIAVVLRAYFLGLLLTIFVVFLPGEPRRLSHAVWKFNSVLGVLIILIALSLSFSNISYVQFFDRPFDSFVFHGLAYFWIIIASYSIFNYYIYSWVSFFCSCRIYGWCSRQ